MTYRYQQLTLGGTLLVLTAVTACGGPTPPSAAVVSVETAAAATANPPAAATLAVAVNTPVGAQTPVPQSTRAPVAGRAATTTAPSSAAGAASECKYATAAEVSAAIGREVKTAAATDPLCAFVGIDSANPAPFNIQVFRSPADIADGRTNMTQSGGVAVPGLGDDALWWSTGRVLYVHQGAAAIRFQDLSAFASQADPGNLLPGLTQLANVSLGRL